MTDPILRLGALPPTASSISAPSSSATGSVGSASAGGGGGGSPTAPSPVATRPPVVSTSPPVAVTTLPLPAGSPAPAVATAKSRSGRLLFFLLLIAVLVTLLVLQNLRASKSASQALEAQTKSAAETADLRSKLEEHKKTISSLETNMVELAIQKDLVVTLTNQITVLSGQLATTNALLQQALAAGSVRSLPGSSTNVPAVAIALASSPRSPVPVLPPAVALPNTNLVEIAKLKVDLEKAKQDLVQRDENIAKMKTSMDDLDKKAISLLTQRDTLDAKIVVMNRELSASANDRATLLKELERMEKERFEIALQLSSITFLRERLRKLREAENVARRAEWMRRGVYDIKKGGQLLMEGLDRSPPKTNHSLDVEISTDGAKRQPPAVQPAGAK